MRRFVPVALALVAFAAQPASAQVLGATNVDVTNPTTFSFAGGTFIFDYDPIAAAAFSPSYSVQTTGTAETSAVFGQPSPFDTRGITIDGNLFPSFASFPTSTVIPYSQVQEDLALRYALGSDFYYGFARLNGNGTLDIGFQSQPNTAITAGSAITGPLTGAVPEPATWAMMLFGFGAIGVGLRRRRTPALALAA